MSMVGKFAVFASLFVIGLGLIIYVFIVLPVADLLTPGVILASVSGPIAYYYFARIRAGHTEHHDEDAKEQARFELRLQGKDYGKK